MSTIPLAKPEYNPDKLNFPVFISEKLDGVPIRVDVNKSAAGTEVNSIMSRQGEHMISARPIADSLTGLVNTCFPIGYHVFVGECTHPDYKDFKDTSGIVRRRVECPELIYNIFDFYHNRLRTFEQRYEYLRMVMDLFPSNIKLVKQHRAFDPDGVDYWIADGLSHNPDAEGFIARSWDAEFKPGTRHWDYQKIVKDPTVDLLITDMQEGIGKNAGGVGRLIALYKGNKIGIGPGKLSYEERVSLWNRFKHGRWTPCLACIKYKRDPSYAALRQATFQHWRHPSDKVEPDA